jgi:hypothetical protein
MNTLTINSKAALTLARAAERARIEKPLVRKTSEYGIYSVRSTSNKSLWYTVTCNSEAKTITCNCPALKPCKHIAAVAPLHSYIARARQEAASQAALALPVIMAQSVQEIEDFIAESNSLDRDCPVCGLVQPDDDSSDCWACGAILNPDDIDHEYTAEMEAKDRADLFG